MKLLRSAIISAIAVIWILAPSQAFGATPKTLNRGEMAAATQKMVNSVYPKVIAAGEHTNCGKYQKSLVKSGYSFTCATYNKTGKETVMTTVKILGVYKSRWNYTYSISPLNKA